MEMSSSTSHIGVIRMMRDYASFISSPSRKSNFLRQEEFLPKLQFDNSDLDTTTSEPSTPDTVSKLKRKLLEKEAEIQHSHATISHLKSSMQSLEPSSKHLCVELEKELELCKQQCEIKEERIVELQNQLQLLKEEEKDFHAEFSQMKEQMDTYQENYEQQIKTLQQKCQKLQLDLEEAKSSEKKIAQDLTAEIKRLQSELKLKKKETEQNKDQIQLLLKQTQEQSKTIQESENLKTLLKKLQQRVTELENEIASNEDAAIIVQVKQEELKALPDLKKENFKLKEENKFMKESCKNYLLLKEQLQSAQKRLEYLQQKNASLPQLELEHEALKQKLSEWESLMSDGNGNVQRSPSVLSKRWNEFQKNEAILMDTIGKLKADISVLETSNQKLSSKVASLTTELQREKKHGIDQATLYRRLQKKVLLVSKELDSYKRVVSSYEDDKSSVSSVQSEHIKSLENITENYRNRVDQLEKECNELQKQIDKNSQFINVEEAEDIEKLRKSLTDQQLKIQQLEKEKLELEEKLNNELKEEETDNSNFKIVHFKQNPQQLMIQQKLAQIKQLKEDNEQLRARIKILEESGTDAQNVTLKIQQHIQEHDSSTVESLKKKLATAKACQKRLMEAVRKTGIEFRELCYVLLGYRIDMVVKNKYKLSHLYAESPDDYLMFEYESGGVAKLLETSYSATLTEMIDLYLKQHDCIPAFLSALTLDLFNRQTFAVACG
ncbi:mitotic spindle assembly checkpoint protein MAD1-like isoform X1 [Centruroides sculpturatus]|uniref:mitotic spindle assembly checkpoint protein MAD1-like isoform X1 n=1 Tax=Centruroides sculpturatus TaxID=218467 RepID=UPI000C6D67C5|nr:mitotic spindle assembly checkpoint protein MAD1-like isoform X1 [Centruroides sculpturatus]